MDSRLFLNFSRMNSNECEFCREQILQITVCFSLFLYSFFVFSILICFCFVLIQQKFKDEDLAIQGYEGQLSKYTNVMKGWQYRFFIINPTRATLEYYMVSFI